MSFDADNAAALRYFVQLPVDSGMIAFLAQRAGEVIACDPVMPMAPSNLPTPPTTPPPGDRILAASPTIPTLEKFITNLVRRSHVQTSTLMSTIVYLSKLKSKLPPVAKGLPCTVHRIFLACLIVTAKYVNDVSPKNKHWAEYSKVKGFPAWGFSKTEVNLMEQQLLALLEWDLDISEEVLTYELEPYLAPVREEMALKRVQRQAQLKAAEERRNEAMRALRLRQQQEGERDEVQIALEQYHAASRNQSPVSVDVSMKDRYDESPHYYVQHINNPYVSSPDSVSNVPGLSTSSTGTPARGHRRGRHQTPASSISSIASYQEVVDHGVAVTRDLANEEEWLTESFGEDAYVKGGEDVVYMNNNPKAPIDDDVVYLCSNPVTKPRIDYNDGYATTTTNTRSDYIFASPYKRSILPYELPTTEKPMKKARTGGLMARWFRGNTERA